MTSVILTLRLLFIIIGIVLITLPLICVQIIVFSLKLSIAEKIPQLYHHLILKLLGIRVHIRGTLHQNVPLIIVVNHISWLDILVIGSCFPCYFIAKSEISSWPIFGFLAKMQNTIFVNRSARGADIGHQVNDLTRTLSKNKKIILFAEGTTSDGNIILPFKSALLAATAPNDAYTAYIQPISLTYQKISGMPLQRYQRPIIAWYGDNELLSHAKIIMHAPPIDVTLHIEPSVLYTDFKDRKSLALYLENTVRLRYTEQINGKRL